jgi:hypothetical protein
VGGRVMATGDVAKREMRRALFLLGSFKPRHLIFEIWGRIWFFCQKK